MAKIKNNNDFKLSDDAVKDEADNNFFFDEESAGKTESGEVSVEAEKEEPAVQEKKTAENKEKPEEKKSKIDFGYYYTIAGILTLICAAVALMLGVVNFATKDVIAEGEEKAMKAAVSEIFTDADDVHIVGENNDIYAVEKDGALTGYCVSSITAGYGGDINLMVGINADGTVQGVKIVSMSETAGLGSKTQNASFLDQFKGKSGSLTVGENVDAVSGATISSKAVTLGVENALKIPVELNALAKELGLAACDTESAESESESETETAETAPADTSADPADVYDPNARESSHIDDALVGAQQNYQNYGKDNTNTYTRDTWGSYLEKETTDTESETESESVSESDESTH